MRAIDSNIDGTTFNARNALRVGEFSSSRVGVSWKVSARFRRFFFSSSFRSRKRREKAPPIIFPAMRFNIFFRRLCARARDKNDDLNDEKEKKADRLCSLHLFNYLSLLLAQTFKTLT